MLCNNCGTALRTNARFCSGCGVPVDDRPSGGGVPNPRVTILLPRSQSSSNPSSNETESQRDNGLNSTTAEILPDPVNGQRPKKIESEIVWLPPPLPTESEPGIKSRQTKLLDDADPLLIEKPVERPQEPKPSPKIEPPLNQRQQETKLSRRIEPPLNQRQE